MNLKINSKQITHVVVVVYDTVTLGIFAFLIKPSFSVQSLGRNFKRLVAMAQTASHAELFVYFTITAFVYFTALKNFNTPSSFTILTLLYAHNWINELLYTK